MRSHQNLLGINLTAMSFEFLKGNLFCTCKHIRTNLQVIGNPASFLIWVELNTCNKAGFSSAFQVASWERSVTFSSVPAAASTSHDSLYFYYLMAIALINRSNKSPNPL